MPWEREGCRGLGDDEPARYAAPHAVPRITARSGSCRHSASQERTSMRAYLTVAGMALGLVALWAALAPLLA